MLTDNLLYDVVVVVAPLNAVPRSRLTNQTGAVHLSPTQPDWCLKYRASGVESLTASHERTTSRIVLLIAPPRLRKQN